MLPLLTFLPLFLLLELFLLVMVAVAGGWGWGVLWLALATAAAGTLLIRWRSAGTLARLLSGDAGREPLDRRLIADAWATACGLLLILPGFLTDLLGLLLLLPPLRRLLRDAFRLAAPPRRRPPPPPPPPPAARGSGRIVEGRAERLDEPPRR